MSSARFLIYERCSYFVKHNLNITHVLLGPTGRILAGIGFRSLPKLGHLHADNFVGMRSQLVSSLL